MVHHKKLAETLEGEVMAKLLTFRLDDIAPGLNRENLNRLESIFDRYGIRPLIGVVPACRDSHLQVEECDEDEFWSNVLRLQDKGWTIALHGYEHVYCNENGGILNANPFSEFAGLSYEEQLEKITKGREELQSKGIKVSFFMAPGHTFDENTLKALVANGIFKVTDGYSKQLYVREGVTFYPCKISEPKVVSSLDTVCIHLNNWGEEEFAELETFLENNGAICTDFDEITRNNEVVAYGPQIMKQEDSYRKLKARKQMAAESAVMQNYLRKSYSDNKIVKLVKRILFLPMLLKR